jgi:hypothetical protein
VVDVICNHNTTTNHSQTHRRLRCDPRSQRTVVLVQEQPRQLPLPQALRHARADVRVLLVRHLVGPARTHAIRIESAESAHAVNSAPSRQHTPSAAIESPHDVADEPRDAHTRLTGAAGSRSCR